MSRRRKSRQLGQVELLSPRLKFVLLAGLVAGIGTLINLLLYESILLPEQKKRR